MGGGDVRSVLTRSIYLADIRHCGVGVQGERTGVVVACITARRRTNISPDIGVLGISRHFTCGSNGWGNIQTSIRQPLLIELNHLLSLRNCRRKLVRTRPLVLLQRLRSHRIVSCIAFRRRLPPQVGNSGRYKSVFLLYRNITLNLEGHRHHNVAELVQVIVFGVFGSIPRHVPGSRMHERSCVPITILVPETLRCLLHVNVVFLYKVLDFLLCPQSTVVNDIRVVRIGVLLVRRERIGVVLPLVVFSLLLLHTTKNGRPIGILFTILGCVFENRNIKWGIKDRSAAVLMAKVFSLVIP